MSMQSSSKVQKTKLSSQSSIDGDEHSHKAHDTSTRAELPRWPINRLQRCEHPLITLKSYAKWNVCKTTDEQVFLSMIFKCISCARITLNVYFKRIIITLLLAEEPL